MSLLALASRRVDTGVEPDVESVAIVLSAALLLVTLGCTSNSDQSAETTAVTAEPPPPQDLKLWHNLG